MRQGGSVKRGDTARRRGRYKDWALRLGLSIIKDESSGMGQSVVDGDVCKEKSLRKASEGRWEDCYTEAL